MQERRVEQSRKAREDQQPSISLHEVSASAGAEFSASLFAAATILPSGTGIGVIELPSGRFPLICRGP